MSTTNTTFTVENLVAKYINFVEENCPKTWEFDGEKQFLAPMFNLGDPERQLLITLYNKVTGEDADYKIQEALSEYSKGFYKKALNEEELLFLCEHFAEVSTICFSHIAKHEGAFLPSQQDIELVKQNLNPVAGSTIFIAGSSFCEIAILFPNCIIKGYTLEEDISRRDIIWALGQIRLYSLGVQSLIHPSAEICMDQSYLHDVDYVVWIPAFRDGFNFDLAYSVYQMLSNKAQMLLFMRDYKAKGEINELSKALVHDKTIQSIVSYESDWCGFMIRKIFIHVDKLGHTIVKIKDIQSENPIDIFSENLDSELLWPGYYVVERPKNGIPFSDIATLVDLSDVEIVRGDDGWILPDHVKKMPVVTPSKMAKDYRDANLLSRDLYLAEDSAFDDYISWIRVLDQPCVLLYGNQEKYVAGFVRDLPQTGIATIAPVACLVPKAGVDVRYITALLFSHEVKQQFVKICDAEVTARTLDFVLKKVIVPCHTDKERLSYLAEANYEALNSTKFEMEKTFMERLEQKKKDYINEVRMRKHDMRPHLRQLASTERLMLHYIDQIDDLDELKNVLRNNLNYMHEARVSISKLVDHLSEEECFGKPEQVDINDYLIELENKHNNAEGFVINYCCDDHIRKSDSMTLILSEELAKQKGKSRDETAISLDALHLYVNIARLDLMRLINNIIENAKTHGFTDSNRNDYYINVLLSIDSERNMYQIDFCNNGNPLPKGMDKVRFGIKGEKAGQTGRTGCGGYIIKSIVSHYEGDYDIFSRDHETIVRIYLPILI